MLAWLARMVRTTDAHLPRVRAAVDVRVLWKEGQLMGLLLVLSLAVITLYVVVTLRSKVVLLEADAYLCHTRIASLIKRVETLEQAEGISYHHRPGNGG
jgi:hypothetical protein